MEWVATTMKSSKTIEGSLCGAADAISASAGARNENLQHYVKRIKSLKRSPFHFLQLKKPVLQTGRELRVLLFQIKLMMLL